MTNGSSKHESSGLRKLIDIARSDKSDVLIKSLDDCLQSIIEDLTASKITLKDVIISLEFVLTNQNHSIRGCGVKIISNVVCGLLPDFMSEKEIETIFKFMDQRLGDHESMRSDVISCFSQMLKCVHLPEKLIRLMLDSLQHKMVVSKVDHSTRKLIYGLLSEIVFEHSEQTHRMGNDFIVGLIHLIEGENHPDCLVLAFKLVSHVAKNYDLDGFSEDFSEWFSQYFPLDYSPPQDQSSALKRRDLVDALYDCFVANSAFAENVMNLVIEKIDSNIETSKTDAYECITHCIRNYPFEKVKTFASSVWACVRSDCLLPSSSLNPKIRSLACRALSSLAEVLNQDNLVFTAFTEDVYNDLHLAFLRVELDLYESATLLSVHAVQPRLSGFLFLLTKMIATEEMVKIDLSKKMSSFALVFQKLHQYHKEKLVDFHLKNLNSLVNNSLDLLESGSTELCIQRSAVDLIVSIVQCKFELPDITIERISQILMIIIDSQKPDGIICTCINTLKTIECRYKSTKIGKIFLNSLPEMMCSPSQSECLKNLASLGLCSDKSFISKSMRLQLNSALFDRTICRTYDLLLSLLDELIERGELKRAINYWLSPYKNLVHFNTCKSCDRDVFLEQGEIDSLLFSQIANIISSSVEQVITPHLDELLNVCLQSAKTSSKLSVRLHSLRCLSNVAIIHDDSRLISHRPRLVHELKYCLADKKRLVRAQAVTARNAWLMVGQPGRILKTNIIDA